MQLTRRKYVDTDGDRDQIEGGYGDANRPGDGIGDGCELINLTKSAHKRVNAKW